MGPFEYRKNQGLSTLPGVSFLPCASRVRISTAMYLGFTNLPCSLLKRLTKLHPWCYLAAQREVALDQSPQIPRRLRCRSPVGFA